MWCPAFTRYRDRAGKRARVDGAGLCRRREAPPRDLVLPDRRGGIPMRDQVRYPDRVRA